MRAAEKSADALASFWAVVQRPVIHVHADKLVRQFTAHIAGELNRMFDGGLAML